MTTETWALKYGCAAVVTIQGDGKDRVVEVTPPLGDQQHLVGCTCARCRELYGPAGRPPVETQTKGTT